MIGMLFLLGLCFSKHVCLKLTVEPVALRIEKFLYGEYNKIKINTREEHCCIFSNKRDKEEKVILLYRNRDSKML